MKKFFTGQVTALLVSILLIMFAVQVFTGFYPGFNASSSPIYKFFTSIFGHSSANHLFNNLFFIGLFGWIFERYTSGKLFVTTFLVSALFANLTAFIFYPESFIIGASGGAMGVLAALAVYRPNQIGLALGVPLPMWAVLIAYTFIQFAGLSGATGTAYEAHLFGMVTGGLIGYRVRDRGLTGFKISEDDEEDNWRQRIRRWEEEWMMD